MRRLFFFAYMLLLLVFSCTDKTPHGVLSFRDMRAVMWDMMRADQFMGDFIFAKDSLANKTKVSSTYYGEVLALHKVSQEDFRESYNYYSAHPKLMQDLMDSISKQVDTSAVWTPFGIDTSRRNMKSVIAQ